MEAHHGRTLLVFGLHRQHGFVGMTVDGGHQDAGNAGFVGGGDDLLSILVKLREIYVCVGIDEFHGIVFFTKLLKKTLSFL